ncbi:MAG: hypothetical protein H6R14_2615 [Proteobacteria bacterium]|nr:hypothetical protein [Pseudomonadota bacterium]
MIARRICSLLSPLVAAFLFSSCASQSIDPQSLSTAGNLPPFELAASIQANHLENSRISYTLPRGQYVAVLKNASGIFFLCPSGIPSAIRLSDVGASTRHLRLLGGIYVPTAQMGKPSVWIVGAANPAVSGRLDIDEAEAAHLGAGCELREVDLTFSAYVGSSVKITILSNDQSARGMSQNMVAGAISTVLVNRIIGANDGRIVFPPVALSSDIVTSPNQQKGGYDAPTKGPE